MKRSEELRAQAQRVGSFRDAYMQLIAMSQVVHDGSFYSHRMRVPKHGQEAEFMGQFKTVARLAGEAHVGPGGVINEIANWKHSFDDVELLKGKDVLEACESVIGMLEGQAQVLEKKDRTLAGRLASFVGFPSRVRAIVAEEHPGMQKAAFGLGVAGQILVGVVVLVMGSASLALITALWRAVV